MSADALIHLDPPVVSHPEASRLPAQGPSLLPRFLFVEDDDDDFHLAQDLLRSEIEASVERALSVDDALDRIAARDFELILLDYSLGARNGLDLLAELRSLDSITPVIFLTGHGDEELAVRALKGGAVDYLAKSRMTRESLATAVRHALALRERDSAVRDAREALLAREHEYRTLFEKANDAILILEPESETVLEANAAASRLYGIAHDQLVGKSLIDFSTDIVRGRSAIEQCLRAGELANFETQQLSRDGRRMHILTSAAVIDYRGRTALLTICRDISERKAAEQEIFRLNRALKALSKCNEALLRAREPQQFLDEICHIVVQVGGYKMAWVAQTECAASADGRDGEVGASGIGLPASSLPPQESRVTTHDWIVPLACAGAELEYVQLVCDRYDTVDSSPLLVPTAIRTGTPAVCRDTATSCLPTRSECAERGFASIIALPLSWNGRISGALAIYAGEPDAFDNGEVELLGELAANVGYGVDSIEARKEREKAQAELRESEERLRNLISTANEGICTIDTGARVTLANATLAQMLGFAPDELIGRSVYDFFVPERREAAQARISAISDTSSARVRDETVLLRADGGKVVVSISTSPIVDSEGRFAGLLAMLNDITEQKTAAESLRASELRLRNMIETASEGIWIIDTEQRTKFVNAKMAAMVGRTPEEMLGRHIQDFDAPQSQIAPLAVARRAIQREQYEVVLLHSDGRRIVTRMNASAIYDADGKYAGAMGMFTDISDQKQAEEKLRESERRYRMLFERNLAGVFRALPDGALLEGNDAFLRMLGYAATDDLQGLKLPEMARKAAASSTANAGLAASEPWFQKLLHTRQLINQEICLPRKDGVIAFLLANLVLLTDTAGNPEFIEGTVLDITERNQLQTQLLQAQKMEAIGQLAGGIAHDFNNLLMVMRSYAEMAKEAVSVSNFSFGENNSKPKVETETLQRQLEAIMKAADRGASLTRQLLTFGRKQTFSPRVLELNSVLENLTKVLPRALGEDIRVELRTTPGLWQVKADPVQIEQLALNLAVNARDAMPDGGRLILETENTFLDSDYVKLHAGVTPGEYVMLAVSDTGRGIPPEILPRIFEPFFTTKERGKGTGLGLATVYGIVQQCGGFVWVYSEVGHGTVFKIYLPRAEGQTRDKVPADSPCPSPPAARPCTETILLVEDEEAVRAATRDYLARRGYQVLEAASGEEAIRSSDEHGGRIDLLITDAVMPGMSGMVLAQKMAERRPGIRILCVSGYTESSMLAHGLSAETASSQECDGAHRPAHSGMEQAFLQKPFSLTVLAGKVRELLDAPKIAGRESLGPQAI